MYVRPHWWIVTSIRELVLKEEITNTQQRFDRCLYQGTQGRDIESSVTYRALDNEGMLTDVYWSVYNMPYVYFLLKTGRNFGVYLQLLALSSSSIFIFCDHWPFFISSAAVTNNYQYLFSFLKTKQWQPRFLYDLIKALDLTVSYNCFCII